MPVRPAFPARRQAVSCAALLLCLWLSACAVNSAYRDGQQLIAQNRIEEGLQKFQQAMEAEPGSARFKSAWLQTRERAVNSFLLQADRIAPAQPQQAQALYQRVLALEPDNVHAQERLRAMSQEPRHAVLLQEAQALQAQKDYAAAKAKVAQILLDNPQHAGALQLQKALLEQTQTPPLQAQLAAAYRKPISIEFKDASVKQVFEVIARTAALNILFDKDVRQEQKMSIILKNSSIEAAIHYALMTNQLEQQILDSNTILVYPNLPAKLKEYQEVVVRSFFLANAEAKSVANSIKTIVKTRDIVVDEKLNMIVVRDSPEAIKIAEKLVALHDQPEPEVMLEVEVLEVKRTRLTNLGIQWPSNLSLTLLPSTVGGTLTLSDLRSNINSRTVQASVGSTVVNANTVDSDVNLLANPRIRAKNHEKAKILIGEKVPNVTSTATSTGFVSESVNYVDVGLKLDVEPAVYLDNDVGIKIGLEVSTIVSESQTKSGTSIYRIGTRSANTVLRLKDGETQVLAGLINDEERRSGNKLPGLGDMPVLGRLFGSAADNSEKTEIVLSITPRLIRNIQRPESTLAEFRAGTDSSMRIRPDAPGAVTLPANPVGNNDAAGAAASNAAANSVVPPGVAPAATNAMTTSATTTATTATATVTSSTVTAGDQPDAAAAPPLPTAPQLSWQGPPNVRVGDSFSLQLFMRADQPVVSLPLAIGFDNKVLQVMNVSEGDFLRQGGAQTTFTNKIDANGQVLLSVTRSNVGNSGGASEAGAIATFTLRALAASDSSRVQLLTIAPVAANGQAVSPSLPAPYVVQVRP